MGIGLLNKTTKEGSMGLDETLLPLIDFEIENTQPNYKIIMKNQTKENKYNNKLREEFEKIIIYFSSIFSQ